MGHVGLASDDFQMLVLKRRRNQTVQIGDDIAVAVSRVSGDYVWLAIEAPRETPVRRGEKAGQEHDTSGLHPLSDQHVSAAQVARVCDWLTEQIGSTGGTVCDAYTKTLRQLEQLLPRT